MGATIGTPPQAGRTPGSRTSALRTLTSLLTLLRTSTSASPPAIAKRRTRQPTPFGLMMRRRRRVRTHSTIAVPTQRFSSPGGGYSLCEPSPLGGAARPSWARSLPGVSESVRRRTFDGNGGANDRRSREASRGAQKGPLQRGGTRGGHGWTGGIPGAGERHVVAQSEAKDPRACDAGKDKGSDLIPGYANSRKLSEVSTGSAPAMWLLKGVSDRSGPGQDN